MWKVIQVVVVLLAIWVGYNYFFGDSVQQEQAQAVTSEVGQGIVALKNFAMANKDQLQLQNLREGTQKVGNVLKSLGANAQKMDAEYRDKYNELNGRKQQLDDLLNKIDDRSRDAKAKKQQISDEMNKLIGDIDRLNTAVELERK